MSDSNILILFLILYCVQNVLSYVNRGSLIGTKFDLLYRSYRNSFIELELLALISCYCLFCLIILSGYNTPVRMLQHIFRCIAFVSFGVSVLLISVLISTLLFQKKSEVKIMPKGDYWIKTLLQIATIVVVYIANISILKNVILAP